MRHKISYFLLVPLFLAACKTPSEMAEGKYQGEFYTNGTLSGEGTTIIESMETSYVKITIAQEGRDTIVVEEVHASFPASEYNTTVHLYGNNSVFNFSGSSTKHGLSWTYTDDDTLTLQFDGEKE